MNQHINTPVNLGCIFLPFSLYLSLTHTHALKLALSLYSHVPPDSTNQDKLQPPSEPTLSYPPSSSSYSVLRGHWDAKGPAVIGLDIIYCPLGNVAFQHLIKIKSGHSNGRYSLKEALCNHLATREHSCPLSFLSVRVCVRVLRVRVCVCSRARMTTLQHNIYTYHYIVKGFLELHG